MAVDVLQEFLTKRLFDVGGDDSRVAPLRDAASDVAALLKAAPQRTAIFTMVAIDGGIGPEEPLVGEVMKVLEKKWQSYAGAFTDRMLPTVARAIILHALGSAVGNESIAAAVSLTARSMLPHLGQPRDRHLWIEIIGDADRRLAHRAEYEWALPSAAGAHKEDLKFEKPAALEAPSLNKSWLVQRLEASAGPHNEAGEGLKEANPYWPNQGQPWSIAFAPKAGNAIAGAVNDVITRALKGVDERLSNEALLTRIAEYVGQTSAAAVSTARGLERRTTLLWWKEALFSPQAQVSYRTLNPTVAAALAAIDASNQTGAFAPRMAEAVVRETLLAIDPAAMLARHSLEDHRAAIADPGDMIRPAIDQAFGAIHREEGRVPLSVALTADGLDRSFETRSGLAGKMEIDAVELGIWLFRDLQAAAATPAPKRKRSGKSA